MNNTIYTFKRYEKKFILTPEQYDGFMNEAGKHFVPDEYHKSDVYSIYYDDESYSLIRRSIDKPVYKEKLRLRSYMIPDENDAVFVELKKKYKGIVYKRRVEMPAYEAERWVAGIGPAPYDSQITREIDWFVKSNAVSPKVFIGVKRTSWVDKDNPELRVTFDKDIRWRDSSLSLTDGDGGDILLKDGKILMEIKIPGGAPIWLARLLSEKRLFPTSYSKYGTCYRDELIKKSQFASCLFEEDDSSIRREICLDLY